MTFAFSPSRTCPINNLTIPRSNKQIRTTTGHLPDSIGRTPDVTHFYFVYNYSCNKEPGSTQTENSTPALVRNRAKMMDQVLLDQVVVEKNITSMFMIPSMIPIVFAQGAKLPIRWITQRSVMRAAFGKAVVPVTAPFITSEIFPQMGGSDTIRYFMKPDYRNMPEGNVLWEDAEGLHVAFRFDVDLWDSRFPEELTERMYRGLTLED